MCEINQKKMTINLRPLLSLTNKLAKNTFCVVSNEAHIRASNELKVTVS